MSQGGFEHILKDLMASSASTQADDTESFDLKYLAFTLHLLRTFIMAAFSTSDADAYEVATLVRKSSSQKTDGDKND